MNTNTNRVTLASTNARIDSVLTGMSELTELVAKLIASNAQMHTSAVVAEITSAPSVRKSTRKSATKATKASETKPAKATVSIEDAHKAVLAGANPWNVLVESNTTGKPVPFYRVARALKLELPKREAAVPASTTKAPAKARSSKAAPKAVAQANPLLGMTGAELKALGKAGEAEIARRAAKRAAKAAK
jgi:hypothetical protein